MGSADMRGLRFVGVQELRFQAWKHSYMSIAVMQSGGFADAQEFTFSNCETFRYGLRDPARGSI